MIPRTNTLFSGSALNGVQTGNWFSAPDGDRLYIPFVIVLSAGTATWILEGVNDISDTANATQIDTATASKALEGQRFKFFRFRLTASAGATITCRTDRVMKQAA